MGRSFKNRRIVRQDGCEYAAGPEGEIGQRRRGDVVVFAERGDTLVRGAAEHVDLEGVLHRIHDPVFRHAETRQEPHLATAVAGLGAARQHFDRQIGRGARRSHHVDQMTALLAEEDHVRLYDVVFR